MLGPGIDNSQSIEVLELATGREIVIYRPERAVFGEKPAASKRKVRRKTAPQAHASHANCGG